jgi:hypothetical protein
MKKLIALVCLLLAPAILHAQTSAQSYYPESLRGLKGMRLVVTFGRAEALEPAKRPELQKLLQNDAEAKFVKAGIPLLRTTGEIEAAPGSPVLICTVTLDKPNGHVFPLVSETRLLQKVMLTHPPSLELTVSTWMTNSIGDYDINDVGLMRLQVGGEIDEFIKEYLAANSK